MYYVFEAAHKRWGGGEVEAWCLNQVDPRDFPPDWWDAEPLLKPLPPRIYAIFPKAPRPDNYVTGPHELYSRRLIDLLQQAGVRFETFPVSFVNRSTWRYGEPPEPLMVEQEYAVFHLLEKYPAIDQDRCHTMTPADPRWEELDDFHKSWFTAFPMQELVMREERLSNPEPFFRALEHPSLVLIHQDKKATLDAAGITGCEYTPVERHFIPDLADLIAYLQGDGGVSS